MKFHDGVKTRWMWQVQGAPPLHKLAPIRTPRSSSKNRHIPVSAYSHTNSGVLHLESGLEHDLVRKLDRDPDVVLLIAQPFRLEWRTDDSVSHVPDLLTQHTDGSVTVWDARSLEQQDDDFRTKSGVTRHACDRVGWRYRVFTGVSTTERTNLLWLHGFRRRPLWADRFEEEILRMAERDGQTVGSLLGADDGTGENISVVWHLVWTGELRLDMGTQWTLYTPISARSRRSHV
ncbi:TnsA-like heteromeric transposase endonuclease subunit [Mycolicibacterium baixiangningiae]|uniref:TnsA-like heteromeric transposase endonuclease subunit n=1 Tax=Mycolicibacterium baixiangningiae TaxID=2761578 RepID=UPI001D0146F1|nr:TnsA-like heteromeric transposase endonuclease subunit [Mycolicibacterium baixiangningiae]